MLSDRVHGIFRKLFENRASSRRSRQSAPGIVEILESRKMLSGTAIIADNSDSSSTQSGAWTTVSGGGYGGSVSTVTSDASGAAATWSFTGLPIGQYYVQATWTPGADRATNALYTAQTEFGNSATVNQQSAPNADFQSGSTSFQTLMVTTVTNGNLTVQLSNPGANGTVVADAVRIQQVDSTDNSVMVRTERLRQIVFAMYDFNQSYGQFPPDNVSSFLDGNNQPYLSWRVYLLPYLGYGDLFQEFHLDEPWNSPNNLPLLSQMPDIFRSRDLPANSTSTGFQRIDSSDAYHIDGSGGPKLSWNTDGLNTTILVLETSANNAVPWTAPNDAPYSPTNPLSVIGQTPSDFTLVSMADGTIHHMNPNISATDFRALVTWQGGESISADMQANDFLDAPQTADQTSQSDLKNLQLGLANFESTYGTFSISSSEPNDPRFDANGNPLLSWRVYLLPFLGYQNLYNQFHLDEPWNSPHNLPLASEMPDIFLSPGLSPGSDLTAFKVFNGPGAFVQNASANNRYSSITDGTSNTISIIEVPSSNAVVWTRPDGDIPFDAANPLAGVGPIPAQGLWVSMFNGTVHHVSPQATAVNFGSFVTWSGGEVLGPLDIANVFTDWVQPDTVQSRTQKLSQIGLGIYNYESVYASLPINLGPQDLDANGQPYLSWRVYLLPFLDEGALFNQFHLDEPWNSPNNLPLLADMPEIFRSRGISNGSDLTGFQLLVGPGAYNQPSGGQYGVTGPKFSQFTDGSNNTILVVETQASQAVEWTRPDGDITFAPSKPLSGISTAGLNDVPADGILTLFADGTVHNMQPTIPQADFLALATWSGNEVLGPDDLAQSFFYSGLPVDSAPSWDTQRKNDLKDLMLAIFNYQSSFGAYPPTNEYPASYFDDSGKPKLSWRVYILPYLGDSALFNQFHLDEAWNSPDNLPLLAEMPDEFRSRGLTLGSDLTGFQFVSGPQAYNPSATQRSSPTQVKDGLSNTIGLIETSPQLAVPWTEPTDFTFNPADPLASLRPYISDSILVAMLDGSVHSINPNMDPKSAAALMTWAGNDNVNNNYLSGASLTPEIALTTTDQNTGTTQGLFNASDVVSFGATTVGTPTFATVQYTNQGSQPLDFSSIQLPTGFSLTTPIHSVDPGLHYTFTIQFDAPSLGTFTGPMTLTTNVPDAPTLSFTLSGVVAAPTAQLSDGTNNITDGGGASGFGITSLGQSVTKTFTVSNPSLVPLIVQPVTVPAGFVVENNFTSNQSIPAGSSATFTVQMVAAALGGIGGIASFATNDPNHSLYTFSMAGRVSSPPSSIVLSSNTVAEKQPVGTVIGQFSSTGSDTTKQYTYSLVSGAGSTDNASFSIDSNGVLHTNAVFDASVKTNYSIRIQSTDQYNNIFSRSLTITVLLQPQVLTVDVLSDTHQNGHLTLREAIAIANTDGRDDTIQFATGLSGTISLTQGELPITASMNIMGPGTGTISINALQHSRVFDVNANDGGIAHVTISMLTIENGMVTGDNGGGILNREALILNNDSFVGNHAAVDVNNLGGSGGGIDNAGTLTLFANAFNGNSAQASGGDIYNIGDIQSQHDWFQNGSAAGNGGDIENTDYATLTLSNDLITQGNAVRGGGIDNSNFASLVSNQNTITNNTAEYGGGIAISNATLTSFNDTLFANKVSGVPNNSDLGGGVYAFGSSISLANDTITANSATGVTGNSGGLYVANEIRTNVISSIIAGNSSGNANPDTNETTLSLSTNIVGGDVTKIFATDQSGVPILAYNGGSTPTVALTTGSPGIGKAASVCVLASPLSSTDTTANVVDATYLTVGMSLRIDSEIVTVTGINGNSLTLLRGQYETSAANHAMNAAAYQALDQRGLVRMFNDMGATDAVPNSSVVTTLSDAEVPGYTTLRDAIGSGEVVTFAPGLQGTITLTQGEIAISGNVVINGPGANLITIDANYQSRIFEIADIYPYSNSATITGLTLTHGVAVGGNGGAIYDPGQLTLANDVIIGNSTAYDGGAIYTLYGSITSSNDAFIDNSAGQDGGAIRNFESVVASTNDTFSGNTAVGNGGAIWNNESKFTLNNDTLSNNVGNYGGGIFNWETGNGGYTGPMTSNGSTFTGNVARINGGGVYNTSGTFISSNDTFQGNSAVGSGGGIADGDSGILDSFNDTLIGNTAVTYGGGLFFTRNDGFSFAPGSGVMVNDTITGNSAQAGGGLFNGIDQSLVVRNTILSGNTAAHKANFNYADNGPYAVPYTGNLVGGDITQILNIGLDGMPLLTDNGGPTQTIAPAPNSLASGNAFAIATLSANLGASNTTATIADASFVAVGMTLRIDSEIVTITGITGTTLTLARGQFGTTAASHSTSANAYLAVDQRGVIRTTNDMGAVRAGSTFVVNTLADSFTPVPGYLTLREAIAQANADPAGGDNIIFAPGLQGSINLIQGALTVTQSMSITSQTSGNIGIDASQTPGQTSGIFVINGNDSGQKRVSFTRLNLWGGNASLGGAIENHEHLTLTELEITGSTANSGGAIYNAGTLSSSGNYFSNDTAGSSGGGAIDNVGNFTSSRDSITSNSSSQNGGAISNTGTFTASNDFIAYNSATGSGGGIFNAGTYVSNNSLLSTNTASINGGGVENDGNQFASFNDTIFDNTANDGGGLQNDSGLMQLTNDTISANSAASAGGGLANNSTLTAINNIISGNQAPSSGADFTASPGASEIDLNKNLVGGGVSQILQTNSKGNVVLSASGGQNMTIELAPNSPADGAALPIVTLAANLASTDSIATVTDASSIIVGMLLRIDSEIVTVTAVNGNQLSLLRGQAKTTATSHATNTSAFLGLDGREVIRITNDLGAVEAAQKTIVVTTLSDTHVNGDTTLREAIAEANGDPAGGDTISFAPGLKGTISSTQGTILIINSMTITTNGSNQISIDGGFSGIFQINPNRTVTIAGLTLTDGHGTSGGAILNHGHLILSNDTFVKNQAAGGNGGAIDNTATVTSSNDTFFENTANYGGGVANDGGTWTSTNDTFVANSANVSGGGIYNNSSRGALFNAINTIVMDNSVAQNPSDVDGVTLSSQWN